MDLIYLTRVTIQNFRTYGAHFSLTLPPGPGLTLIAGCNGLGKTTFFDAMEWALTGKVIRIQTEPKSKPLLARLVRRDRFKRESSCKVELQFGEAGQVERLGVEGGADEGQVVVTGAGGVALGDNVTALLLAPHWRRTIHKLDTYLALTHFLTQSERPRFFRLESARMWDALEGPTGAAHLETLRKQLDRTTSFAFSRAKEAAAAALVKAEEELTRWQEQGRLLDQLRQAAAAGSGITPQAVMQELAAIWLELRRERPNSFSDAEPGRALADTAAALVQFEREAVAHGELATSASNILRAWLKATGDLATARSEMGTIQQQSTEGQQTLQTLRIAAEEATKRQDTRSRDYQAAKQRFDTLTRLLRSIDGGEAEAAALIELNTGLARIETELAIQKTALADTTALVARHEDLQLRRTQASTEVGALEALRDRLERCLAAEQSLAGEREAHDAAARQLLLAQGALQDTEQTERRSLETLANAETQLAAARATLSEIGNAVARLASLLGDHETICPLCATEFSAPETLRQRADGCATRADHRLGPLLEQTATARQAVETAREAAAAAKLRTEAAEQTVAVNVAAREQTLVLRAAMDAEPRLIGQELTAQMSYVTASISKAKKDVERYSAEQTILPNYEGTVRNLAAIDRAIISLEERRSRSLREQQESRERQALWVSQQETEATLLRENGGTSNAVRGAVARLQIEVEALEESLTTVQRETDEATKHASNGQVTLAAIRSRLASIAEAVARFAQTQKSAVEQWRSIREVGEPNEVAVQALRFEAENRLGLHRQLIQRREAALRGWGLWQSNRELHKAEASQRGQLATDESPEARTAVLHRKVQEAGEWNRKSEEAFDLSKRLAEALKNQQQQYTDDVLEPFSERVSAFERMISPFQNEVVFQTQHRSDRTTRSNVSIRVPRLASNVADEYDIHTRLSEGQVSALGVSMIFGASTAYDWSRWRALLLDDPLQHTDLIHASAFVDVLRALIVERGYQVVISSHDMEESDFIARKCRRFGIPLQQCVLIGAGEDGVRSRISGEF